MAASVTGAGLGASWGINASNTFGAYSGDGVTRTNGAGCVTVAKGNRCAGDVQRDPERVNFAGALAVVGGGRGGGVPV